MHDVTDGSERISRFFSLFRCGIFVFPGLALFAPAVSHPTSEHQSGRASSMPHDLTDLATSLVFFPFSVIALYAPALIVIGLVFWFWRRRLSRLDLQSSRQRHIREKILEAGLARRQHLALASQRRNIGELAGLVRTQLEDHKLRMSASMRQRVAVFIEQAVTSVDFDRLYVLYALFANSKEQECVSPAMELFFDTRGNHVDSRKHRQVHIQIVLHGKK
jgi:hypothetical protein